MGILCPVMSALDSQAIDAALRSDWNTAVTINREILRDHLDNLDALSRLAFALSKNGELTEAVSIYETILQQDSCHQIARKNLQQLVYMKSHGNHTPHANGIVHHTNDTPISPGLFITDTQKTKTVKLINPAPCDALQPVCCGEKVYPFKRRFELQVKNKDGVYLGTFPDNIGRPLLKILVSNKPCTMYVKDIQEAGVSIFVIY